MKLEDFRRGLVRICDGEGVTRGSGFFVSSLGHVLTCDHVVQGTQQLFVELADGRRLPFSLASELSCAELDFAVLNTNAQPPFVVPIEFAGAPGEKVWTTGFQMQGGAIRDALPTFGTITGLTALEYNFEERTYKLPEILRLEDATVEPGLSGAFAVLERDLVAVGLVNARLGAKGGFILPFRAARNNSNAFGDLLDRNRASIPRYGKYLNGPGLFEVCRTSSHLTLKALEKREQYLSELFVQRNAVEAVLDRFLESKSRILPIVGQTGTGKTTWAAHVTERLRDRYPTVLVLAYRLSPGPGGIQASVSAELNKSNPELPALTASDFTASPEAARVPLIVVLDGLNELPGTIQGAREWLESTWDWLGKNANARLVVTCRPEYWNSVREFFDEDLVYSDSTPATDGKTAKKPRQQKPSVLLGEFTESEATIASSLYKLANREKAGIFRHPLFYGIARKGFGDQAASLPSIDRLFSTYIDSVVSRIRSVRAQPPSQFLIRSTLNRLASTLRENKNLWIRREQFLNAFSADTSLMDAFLGEHLLVEGEGGIRFAFDEMAYYLVAQSAAEEFEKTLGTSVDWTDFRKSDPVGADSVPLFLSQLEEEKKKQVVAQILDSLARQSHDGDEVDSYDLHTLFLRFIQWLRTPSDYFAAVELFARRCMERVERVGSHILLPLVELSGITSAQQMHLLSIMATRENDRRNRWKEWENCSDEEFWNQGSFRLAAPTFRIAVRNVIEQNANSAISELAKWLKYETKLDTYSPPSEATVSDLSCGILFHSASRWLDLVANGLAQAGAHESASRANTLLVAIMRKFPVEMLGVCERWAKSSEFPPLFLAGKVNYLLALGPRPELAARLLDIIDGLQKLALSLEEQAVIAGALSQLPSTAGRALDIVERLDRERFAISPSLLQALIPVDPDRVLAVVDSVVVRSTNQERQWAFSALDAMAKMPSQIPRLLSIAEQYLDSYPQASYGIALVVEQVCYETRPASDEVSRLQGWLRKNYLKIDAKSRMPVIYGVINRAEKIPTGMSLLQTVLELETPKESLGQFLSLLPSMRLPYDERLRLLIEVANRMDQEDPRYEALMYAVVQSMNSEFGKYLADQIAAAPSKWSPSQVQFSNLVASGKQPFYAAYEVLDRKK